MPAERFPLAPLLACTTKSRRALAAAAGIDPAHLLRLMQRGWVNELQADRLAIALGLHPAMIWPDQWLARRDLVIEGLPIGPLLECFDGEDDLTSRRLAHAAGVTRRTWCRWAAKGTITPAGAEALCSKLAIEPAEVWPDWPEVRRARWRKPARRTPARRRSVA